MVLRQRPHQLSQDWELYTAKETWIAKESGLVWNDESLSGNTA